MYSKGNCCSQNVSCFESGTKEVHRRLKIEEKDGRFRVEGMDLYTKWLPDTQSNRNSMVIWLRLLCDDSGNQKYTYQELSVIVGSENRQASSGHMEGFRRAGEDMLAYLRRRKKVDDEVVKATERELRSNLLAEVEEICKAVNKGLNREDITEGNIWSALEQIPYKSIRTILQEQLLKGEVHYKEEYLLKEMMKSFNFQAGKREGIVVGMGEGEGMVVSDPTTIRALLTPGADLSSISQPVQVVSLIMTLYYHGIGLSVLGKWCSVHKSTILRWILGLGLLLWPSIWKWIKKEVKATRAYIDEKWLKIRGKWYYWFVVLDERTGIPILSSLLDSRGGWSCRWIGCQLRNLGQLIQVIITDGMVSYEYLREELGEKTKHLLCHFHHQQATSRWVEKHFKEKEETIKERKKELKKVLQTNDKRTVKRRFKKLKGRAKILGIEEWINNTEKLLPNLLPGIGSKKYPKTNNVIERFFRSFNQFYKRRCGFFSIASAKREIIFFLVMYLFIQQVGTGKSPLEVIIPQVREMPFYHLVNNPLQYLVGLQNVKQKKNRQKIQMEECLRL